MSTRESDPRGLHDYLQVRRNGDAIPVARAVADELRLEVFVNERRLLAYNCSAINLREMVTGFLWLEQLIEHPDDIDTMRICVEDRVVEIGLSRELDLDGFEQRRALTSGCGGGVTFQDLMSARAIERVEGGPRIDARRLFELIADLFRGSSRYRASGGLHAAALADHEDGILVLCEDLGRHNTIDKVAGECLLRDVDPIGKILLSTGRMSSDMVIKAARMRVPIVASRTSPTDLSIALATEFGLTVVGYVRGDRCHLYTGAERIRGIAQPAARR